ncbi:MAG: Uma2 family endonuclease [Spirulina sp. SIO3F2]|nr:Uma2 family endonuclease [Spirulina sp. SIO3F2]
MTQTPLKDLPKTPIVYPEPDGAPMAESDPARDYLIYGVEALKQYFQARSNVYVSGNLWLSYEQGVPDAVVCPDVFVVFGVEDRPRRSYRVWLENNKMPDWVLEVTFAKTRNKDDQDKPITYARMGVPEYFQYDPTGDYLNPPLKGRRLQADGSYGLLQARPLSDGRFALKSEVLGLELHLLATGQLRFFDPERGEYLRTPQETEQARQQEYERAERERVRAEQAEAELEALRDRLRAQGIEF